MPGFFFSRKAENRYTACMETLEQEKEPESTVPKYRRGRPRKGEVRIKPDTPPRGRGKPVGTFHVPVRSHSRLREFRIAAQMTQKEIADLVGVAQGAIAQAETIGTGIGEDKWEELASLFGTDLLSIRGWTKIYAK